MANDVVENFDDIDLDMPETKKVDTPILTDELSLDDLEPAKTEEVVTVPGSGMVVASEKSLDDIDFSDLDAPVTSTVAPVVDHVEATLLADPNTKANKAKDLDEVDLDLGIEMTTGPDKPTVTPPTKEKKPRGRKPKADKPAPVVSNTTPEDLDKLGDIMGDEEGMLQDASTDTPDNVLLDEEPTAPADMSRKITFVPDLNIEYLECSLYQTRTVERSVEEIAELATLIKRQGQLEPVHVVIKGEAKFLVAGFGRIAAIKHLGQKTAKAIVYEGITEDEIIKISSGTNTGRLELRDWDKISSVGLYASKNPMVAIKELPGIFGFEKTAIYQYIAVYEFFKDKKEYLDYFKKNAIPQYMFNSMYKQVKEFPTIPPKKVLEFVDATLNFDHVSAQKFNVELVELISKEKSNMQSIEKENKFDGLEIEPDNINTKDVSKEAKEILDADIKGANAENNASKEVIIAHCFVIIKQFENISTEIDKIMQVPEFKKLMPSNIFMDLCKKVSDLQLKASKLV